MKNFVKATVLGAALSIVSACQQTGGETNITVADEQEAFLISMFLLVPVDWVGKNATPELVKRYPTWTSLRNGTLRYPLRHTGNGCPSRMICPTLDFTKKTWTFQGRQFALPPSINENTKFLNTDEMSFMANQLISTFGESHNPIVQAMEMAKIIAATHAASSSGGNSGGSDSGNSGGSESGGGDDG